MQHPDLPDVLYKYASPSTSLLVLTNGRMRWSSPGLFNDPAEFQRMPRFEPSLTDAQRLLPAKLMQLALARSGIEDSGLSPKIRLLVELVGKLLASGLGKAEIESGLISNLPDADIKAEAELRAFFQQLDHSKARILCLTTEFNNDAMWANYAQDNTGCAFGFRHIPSLSTPLLAAKPVAYTDERPIAGAGLDFLLSGDNSGLRRKIFESVCFTKRASWSYEREWRVLTWRDEEATAHGDYKFYASELESVTLGSRSTQAHEDSVSALMRTAYPHAALYRIGMVNGEPRRKPVNLTGTTDS